jgi:hypothetical protein
LLRDKRIEFVDFSCGRPSANINRGAGIRRGVEFVRLSLVPCLLSAIFRAAQVQGFGRSLSLVLKLNRDHTLLP